jgi:undecaprenyl-diphosphatase
MRTNRTVPDSPARRRWIERDRLASRLLHRAARRPFIVALLAGVSWLSDGPLWYALIIALPWAGGADGTACALRMVGLGALNLVVYKIMKQHFARPRPFMACADIRACARSLDEYSFPSGHALYAVAFGVLLCTYYPVLAVLVWPFVALIALSRVVLGLHYPSDVIAGAALGWLTAGSVLLLF